jgi:Flp pilus assembly protein TadG
MKLAPFSLFFRLYKDLRGFVLTVQFTIYLVVIMGMIGLVIDGSRFILLNNGLQDLADAAALAGAAQLDGAQDAITRATNAANGVSNTPSNSTAFLNNLQWASGNLVQSVTFYGQLNPDTTTTDPKEAAYIKVTTGTWGVGPWFLVAVGATQNSTSTSATAQGPNSQSGASNCAPTQSFICNPYEATETNPGNANNFVQNVSPGTMIHLVNGAGAAGNWGLIQAPNENSNPHNQTPFWAETTTGPSCVTGPQGTTDTGNVAKFAQSGINVRFDSPVNVGTPTNAGDETLSAPVVISGFYPAGGTGSNKLGGFSCQHFGNGYPDNGLTPCSGPPNTCVINGNPGGGGNPVYPPGFNPNNYGGSSSTDPAGCNANTPLPSAATCTSNPNSSTNTNPACISCPLPRDRTFTNNVGNGPNLTDLQAYWQNHHSGSLPSGVTSRYQIYQGEASGSYAFISDAAEPHAPLCTNSTVGPASRRVFTVAATDCTYWGITGTKPLPPTNLLIQFFITEPALDDGSIFAEYVGCFTNDPAADPTHKCATSSSVAGTGQAAPLPPLNVQLVR